MIAKIPIERMRKVALITSAGLSVVVIDAAWPAAPSTGGVRPALIISTSQVNMPVVSTATGAGVLPSAIASLSAVGMPTFAKPAQGVVAPAVIASAAAVGAPTITAPATINNTQGDANLTGNDVGGFASRAQALDARLIAMGY